MNKYSYFAFLLLVINGIFLSLNAQVSESKIKALYIYQIAQQIEWPNDQNILIYQFGIVSSDELIIENLKQISETSSFKGKKINVEKITNEEACSECQLVFIDENYKNQVGTISKLYDKQQSLIISYEATDKLFTMVNLYKKNNENTITYEINRDNIENQGFAYTPELLVHGGSLIDLKELYLSSAKELNENKAEIKQMQNELSEIKKEKNKSQEQVKKLRLEINSKEKEYANLNSRVSIKDSTLKEMIRELEKQSYHLNNLEQDLEKKQTAVRLKEIDLENLNKQYESNLSIIANQSVEILNQKKEITNQASQINTQTETISTQRTFILMLILLGLLVVGGLIVIWIAFRMRKQMNAKLSRLVDERTKELNISKEYYRTLAEYSPVPLLEVNITNLLGYINEITSSGESLDNLINEDPKVLSDTLDEFEFIDLNRKAFELFKVDNIENFKKNFKNIFVLENTDFLVKGFKSLSQKENTYHSEAQFTTLVGNKIQAMVTWILLPENFGNQNHLLIAIHDITKLKEYETELMKHRDNLELLVQERAQEIVDLNKLLTNTNESLNNKNFELNAQKDELEKALSLVKQTQKQLVESEKMASLGMLTAGVAHEINNPINFINSGSQALTLIFEDLQNILKQLEAKEPSNSDVKIKNLLTEINDEQIFENISMIMESIEDGVKRTTEIVNSLRTYSYDSTESFQTFNISEAIDNSLVILKNKTKNRITINKDIDPEATIECLPGKINQVLVNVLSNAIDAIPKKGNIEISAHFDDSKDFVNIYFKDDGVGIDKDNINKLYEPFYTTKEVGTGTGLGLYITYGIIKQHNGALTIDSEPNKGTSVKIYLPVKHIQ